MTTKSKQLVCAGHDLASELKADCGAVDMRSVANLLTELASALDVQSARSEALAAKLNDVCAENAALIGFDADEFSYNGPYQPDDAVLEKLKTPATDAWVNEQRAVGVDGAIEKLITMLNHQSTGVSASINVLRTFAAQLRGSQV
ncbi:hypothetical protein [Atlantibacter hermannii]|uniref:hypothetical protein n=1 Tax=Atlantibacter hermannii TaxID=565 RepID=UPI00289A2DB1|nr:hypothetical protein [Atlantibacter hermannii]